MHLYELTDQMRGLQHLIDQGELSLEVLHDTLEGLEGDIQAKGKGTLEFMANLQASALAYDTEIKRLQARKKTFDTHFEWLKNYLRDNMAACNITKIESPTFTATLGKPPQVCDIFNEDLIPDEFIEVVPEVKKYPKPPIMKALKAGQDVPGARIAEGKHKITIR
jgi:hypothetical protein